MAGFYVYNSTFGEGQLGHQQWFNAQNDIYVNVRPDKPRRYLAHNFKITTIPFKEPLTVFRVK